MKPKRGPMTAAEVMAIKAHRLATDEDYARRVREIEDEQQARAAALRRAERPIVEDLNEAGVPVDSVWNVRAQRDPAAIPVLIDHLQRGGYPDRVMEALGQALGAKQAAFAWDTLLGLYVSAVGRGEMEGLAVALAGSATPDRLDDLIDLLDEESRADTRIHFLRAIKRVGGVRGREVLESLRSDPVFGKEARHLLKKRRSS